MSQMLRALATGAANLHYRLLRLPLSKAVGAAAAYCRLVTTDPDEPSTWAVKPERRENQPVGGCAAEWTTLCDHLHGPTGLSLETLYKTCLRTVCPGREARQMYPLTPMSH